MTHSLQETLNKNLMVVMAALLLSPPTWGCNPNQDCMTTVRVPCPTWKYPFRSCLKRMEDTLCAAARKVCQKDCKVINRDANSYIFGFRAEKQRVRNEIATIDSAVRAEQHHEGAYQNIETREKEALAQFESAAEHTMNLLPHVAVLDQFLQEFQLHGSHVDRIIEASRDVKDPLINAMGAMLELSKDLELYANDLFETQNLAGSIKRMALLFKSEAERIKKQISTAQLSKSQSLQNRSELEAARQQRFHEIQELERKSNEQEKRKCTPW